MSTAARTSGSCQARSRRPVTPGATRAPRMRAGRGEQDDNCRGVLTRSRSAPAAAPRRAGRCPPLSRRWRPGAVETRCRRDRVRGHDRASRCQWSRPAAPMPRSTPSRSRRHRRQGRRRLGAGSSDRCGLRSPAGSSRSRHGRSHGAAAHSGAQIRRARSTRSRAERYRMGPVSSAMRRWPWATR